MRLNAEVKVKGKNWKLTAIITLIVAALLSYGVYYAQGLETERNVVTTILSYEQTTSHDYTAHLKNNTLYGESIGEGETIYIELVDIIDLSFNYAFDCSKNGSIEIDYVFSIRVEEPSETGWSKAIDELVPVEASLTENATSATLVMGFSYNITEISELIEKIEEEIQYTAPSYHVNTTININVTDHTACMRTISESLDESVVLKLGYRVVEVEASDKSLPRSITENHTEKIEYAINLRTGTIIALVSWILVGSGLTAKRYRGVKSGYEELPEAERIMLDLEAVESKDMPDLKAQTLSSIEALKKIAGEYSSIIFHYHAEGEDVFFITENNILYQYISEKTELA